MCVMSSSTEVCFNSYCKEASEKCRRGWRRRSGDYAHLCDCCAIAYENGIFCETFHVNASGWRCCESCGKQIHCGCIVSFHMFVLLDAGGIECSTCARKSYILTPNPAWPPPLDFNFSQPERKKDMSVKTRSPLAGSRPVPWRQAPSLFNGIDIQSNAPRGMSFETCVSGGTDKTPVCDRISTASPEMKQAHSYERFPSEKSRLGPSESLQNRNTGVEVMVKPCHYVNDTKTVNRKADNELRQLSGDSKSVITPLFEKMLSASDAGRIGRLILPKRCAEVYFPQITHPEGLPLKIQDLEGKEWVFQFRFWPNNNSRMYVLEGVTPCIQSMQLQAGDIVTFSRLEPEGKLLMGCRKNSATPSSDQRDEGTIFGVDASNVGDGISVNKHADVIYGHTKDKVLEYKPIIHSKRKNSGFDPKCKRLPIENEDVIELKLTWKEAQGLMRPPSKIVPSIFVVEGCAFEEFEEAAPVIGRPTLFGIDHNGAKSQWVQCEECFKWRKVPTAALLPSRWICLENVWDLDRSKCSSAEELSKEELEHMLHLTSKESSKETTGRDTAEGPPDSSENSRKYPHHKPGCACIFCLQPRSGKAFTNDQSCECVVSSCLKKRRFRTQIERKLSEKEAETSSRNFHQSGFPELPEKTRDLDNCPLNQERPSNEANIEELNGEKPPHSPLNGQIDLNIRPDKEEESSLPMSCTERYFRQVFGL